MKKIRILDCTLRDGGYCNNWTFGYDNIKKICKGLIDANIEIIEMGFLSNKASYRQDITKYSSLEQVESIIAESMKYATFVVMLNYGEYDVNLLPDCNSSCISGIRVAFHKKDMEQALEQCKILKWKGYKVFIQAMVSLSYSDEEFLNLIHIVNQLEPYAFYIVDSFGTMKGKELIRLFYMVENNISENIVIGFHCHNNMQLAYSNAQTLVATQTNRDLIIDCSIYGMGRGAGNLNTELFTEYLNETNSAKYKLRPLLTVIDEVLTFFYAENPWGYSLPNYLSAKYQSHPNYAGYLDERKTLTIENMDEIFSIMDGSKRYQFDQKYIEKLYEQYMENNSAAEERVSELKNNIRGKDILIIAQGKSSYEEANKILAFISQRKPITISINREYKETNTDYIFVSNIRRFKELNKNLYGKCIATSNIPTMDTYYRVKYSDLINPCNAVRDNAGMMLIKLLINLEARCIYVAGMDGYSADPDEDYGDKRMSFYHHKANAEAMNDGMNAVLSMFKKEICIEFVTTQRFIDCGTVS